MATIRQNPRKVGAPKPPMRTLNIRPAPRDLELARIDAEDKYAIPDNIVAAFRDAGWALEWKRHSVLGQEDTTYQMSLRDNHWEPVQSDECPGLMPDTARGAVMRDGLMLMKRPDYLSRRAVEINTRRAVEQVQGVQDKIMGTPAGTLTRDHPSVQKILRNNRTHDLAIPEDEGATEGA